MVNGDNNTVSSRLGRFLELNPEAKLSDQDNGCIIESPWGDDSIAFRVSSESSELIEDLNSLRFPPRFTALWHTESKDLEFIYTFLSADHDERGRRFLLQFNNRYYTCEYTDASRALNLLVNAFRVAGPVGETTYRNLSGLKSFLRYQKIREQANEPTVERFLTSFWVRNVDLSEEDAVLLARHINFYMHYFDRRSSRILIHEEPIREISLETPVRYPSGAFPAEMLGRELDPFLLSLWESSSASPDPFRRFLYNYQIVEYSAFYYLREEISQAIRRVIASPDIPSRLEEASRQILDVVVADRATEESKLTSAIQHYVDPSFVWSEIEPKTDFFSKPTEFDGGFSVVALVKQNWTLDDFRAAWIPKLPDSLRKIRNALVHARESRQAHCVLPTARNQHLLRPWTNLMSAIAIQIMVYSES